MKKILFIFSMLCISITSFASPKVESAKITIEQYNYYMPVVKGEYTNKFTIIENSLNVYEFKNNVVVMNAKENTIVYRIRINNKWYCVSKQDFVSNYVGKKLTKKQLKKLEMYKEI